MKQFITISFLLFSINSFSQVNEFNIHDNGLIYSNETMGQLEHIVDSLNLKFNSCGLNKDFYAKKQCVSHYITYKGKNAKKVLKEIEKGNTYSYITKTFPPTSEYKNLHYTQFKYITKKGDTIINFRNMTLDLDLRTKNIPYLYSDDLKGKWHFNYQEKTNWSEERLHAYYFVSNLEEKLLPEKYARMIQYAECLIDTNNQIHPNYNTTSYIIKDSLPNYVLFIEYINKATKRPIYSDDKGFWNDLNKWKTDRFKLIDSIICKKDTFQLLLENATNEAVEQNMSTEEFEEYVLRYNSKEKALSLKRNRVVIGQCSMDDSPRKHAVNIALLSAETTKWEIFLRAHLNIMNDRFERTTDGSYAQSSRKTYIKELEELDIDVHDLLLGISLRIENESENHYYGNIGRLGRALSETKDKLDFEIELLEMIEDNSLDVYNRLVLFYLFDNYNHYLDDELQQNTNTTNLKTTIYSFPPMMQPRLMSFFQEKK